MTKRNRKARLAGTLVPVLVAILAGAQAASSAAGCSAPTPGTNEGAKFGPVTSVSSGPGGILADDKHLFVAADDGIVYRFKLPGASGTCVAPEMSLNTGMDQSLVAFHGHYYGLVSAGSRPLGSNGVWEFDPVTLKLVAQLVRTSTGGDLSGLAADPRSGDLYFGFRTGANTTGGGNGIYRIHDPESDSPKTSLFIGVDRLGQKHEYPVRLAFSPDGAYLYVVDSGGRVHELDRAEGTAEFKEREDVFALAVRRPAAGGGDQDNLNWELVLASSANTNPPPAPDRIFSTQKGRLSEEPNPQRLYTSPNAQKPVDLTVSPGGCLYSTQFTYVFRLAGFGPASCDFQFSGNPVDPTIRPLLTVQKTGTGIGNVTSAPAGINCGTRCQSDFAGGTALSLTATKSTDATHRVNFDGWTGSCQAAGNSCSLTLTNDTIIKAEFNLAYQLQAQIQGPGSGSVTSYPAGIDCGESCRQAPQGFDVSVKDLAAPPKIALEAVPDPGSVFLGWVSQEDRCKQLNCSNPLFFNAEAAALAAAGCGADQACQRDKVGAECLEPPPASQCTVVMDRDKGPMVAVFGLGIPAGLPVLDLPSGDLPNGNAPPPNNPPPATVQQAPPPAATSPSGAPAPGTQVAQQTQASAAPAHQVQAQTSISAQPQVAQPQAQAQQQLQTQASQQAQAQMSHSPVGQVATMLQRQRQAQTEAAKAFLASGLSSAFPQLPLAPALSMALAGLCMGIGLRRQKRPQTPTLQPCFASLPELPPKLNRRSATRRRPR